ncbi:uncharacterized protein F5891DRAFT_636145 [Suillus fuscotomentosus]|uniref:Secreted protein n=1 Tax=Suillus fuscotomentosus TaxID=1912939 RepID=A0AAD4HRL3_9AGAM|nr:uncharacterized protein F5891DRAFT_636145 [Suillus fuscotomentosus]KAG1905996.1 hypothetical protein F5891DRAFT_636145 [Suillus fuscotomentosus]
MKMCSLLCRFLDVSSLTASLAAGPRLFKRFRRKCKPIMFTCKLYAVSFTDVTNEKTLISRCHSPVDMIAATVNLNFQYFASTYLITLF